MKPLSESSAMHEHHADPADQFDRFPYSTEYRTPVKEHERYRVIADASSWRQSDPLFARWAKGYGVIQHDDQIQVRIRRLVTDILGRNPKLTADDIWELFYAADRLTSAAMWLVVHMTYAKRVRIDGAPLEQSDFKLTPDGHTGGSLNMVPAYIGYLLANALTGQTRSWMMGQGHCVAAIEAVNVLVNNLYSEQAARYDTSEKGLSTLCADFYSYAIGPDGRPAAPLGSHVNAHTAGGLIEGGYLGFAELQYVHMPLPDESLVAFLSDGSFEEQRGADWAPRWWRASDSGMITPVMILNGRRIEQRTTVAQDGGVAWFAEHLRLNGFDPIAIDGTDPAAFCWAILESEARLSACADAAITDPSIYPAPLHYIIAQAPKGYGFPGAGTNLSHNLPLGKNPAIDASARDAFNTAARQLWVQSDVLTQSVDSLNNHSANGRQQERDHPLTQRDVRCVEAALPWREPNSPAIDESAMNALDEAFLAITDANADLRVRIGNPDELRSNGMPGTLDRFRHRTADPEEAVPETVDGAVITALNEEAVVSAALANKGGLNLVVTYEAFAVKMLGAMRQEMTFARQQSQVGRPPRWLSVPIVLSSHAWENGKNEISHQDTTLCEAWLAEPSDRARAVFPIDANTAIACLARCYATQGEIWAMVVPKRPVPTRLDAAQAERLVSEGMLRIVGSGAADEELQLVAIGAYQLSESLRASKRLVERNIPHSVVVINEPGRLRIPRDQMEAKVTSSDSSIAEMFPRHTKARVIVSHTRTELLAGVLRRIDTGPASTSYLGFINRGGTLDTFGMLFTNRCTWAHILDTVAQTMEYDVALLLDDDEVAAARGDGDPQVLR